MDAHFWLQGVVKNGQVVLETPLDLPDGTVVTVMNYDPDDDPRPIGPTMVMTDEEFAEFTEFFTGRRPHSDGWAEFEARVKRAQADRVLPTLTGRP
ncbi:MAG: hypothetical protein K2P78_09340 [Gemmataceae bacterium]|nr:hypothetical protein [Gemmataceae bacterium]